MSRPLDPLSPTRESGPMLRDAQAADRAFLLALYASTRADELERSGWPPETQRVFVQMQYDAQHADYSRRHPDSRCQIIELLNCPIGRLWVACDSRSLTILDISVIPSLQGRGIGTDCMHRVLRRAREARLDVELQVVTDNPARRLYERLGFRAIGDPGVRQAMTWTPPTRQSSVCTADPMEMHHEQT
jgi:ribosomal protein S18 acetylase RimI-like enzyme